MPATRDGKLWRSQFYYKDWQGVRRKKNKRGFKTKGEADEWERNFLQQQQKNLDISFENFVEIYFADMENRLRESTIINKRYVFDLKVTPYFKHKKMLSLIHISEPTRRVVISYAVFCLKKIFLMIRRPPRSTLMRSSAASDVYKRQS